MEIKLISPKEKLCNSSIFRWTYTRIETETRSSEQIQSNELIVNRNSNVASIIGYIT